MADSTSDNGSSLAGLPVWARVASVVGIPAAILAWMFWSQTPKLDAIANSNAQLRIDMETQKDQSWNLYGVLQRICINTAKSDEDKKACTTITQRPVR